MPVTNSKHRKLRVAAALPVLLLIVALAYWAGGTNWAAAVFAVGGIGLWLWSARRSYRAGGPGQAPRLVVDRVGELANEEQPRASYRRIRVANAGTFPLRQVEVTLIGCSPTPLWFQP